MANLGIIRMSDILYKFFKIASLTYDELIITSNFIELSHLQLRLLLQILVSLEAWDQRKIDEPDHEARHNAYSQLFEV